MEELNEMELDQLTNDTLQALMQTMQEAAPPCALSKQYETVLKAQQQLKDLYTKGFHAGVGHALLNKNTQKR